MDLYTGFDMVPPLSGGKDDQQNWQSFINEITERYRDDEDVEIKQNYIESNKRDHPLLPFEGHKLLDFGSRISDTGDDEVQEYIHTVFHLARLRFGQRVQPCDGPVEGCGHYNWEDVRASFKTYEQSDEQTVSLSTLQDAFNTCVISEPDHSLFEIKLLPGKGRGLMAKQNIAAGTRILVEKPLLLAGFYSNLDLMEDQIETTFKTLTKAEQGQFLSLHNNHSREQPFSGIVRTNALPCEPDEQVGGVYATACFINHSCLPNTHYSWNSEMEWGTIHAVCDIKIGEEITIAYDDGMPSTDRHVFLKDSFGFDCDCHLCGSSSAEVQISDFRRIQIPILQGAIWNSIRMTTQPEDCLIDCRQLREILKAEYQDHADITLAGLYYDAFKISITHGDQARAIVFAQRAHQMRVICEGDDSPKTQRMKQLMERPTTHENFGTSQLWKTEKTMVPKGLDASAFEEWLWKQED